jgi:hypothetical protein
VAIYAGAAFTSASHAIFTRFFSLALGARVNPMVPADNATFEQAAGTTAVKLFFGMFAANPLPAAPTSIVCSLLDGNTGTVVSTATVANPADGLEVDLFATTNGLASGTPIIGSLRIKLEAISTSPPGYDVNSDTDAKQGVVRINPTSATLTESVPSGLSPQSYPDTQTVQLVLSHAPFADLAARTFAFSIRDNGTPTTAYKSATSPHGTITTYSTAFTADNAYPAAATVCFARSVTAVSTIPPTSTPGFAWTKLPGATGPNSDTLQTATFTVDPRLTDTHLFEIDDNTWHTPPMSANVASGQWLSTSSAFLDSRFTNARGEGANGITYNTTFTPTNPGQTLQQIGTVTATEGGQIGWGNAFLANTQSKPGGTWTKQDTITAPANIVGAAYLSPSSIAYTMIAFDPRLQLRATAAPYPDAGGTFAAGQVLRLAAALVLTPTGTRQAFDVGMPIVRLVRFNTSTNRWQHLISDTDPTPAAWATLNPGDALAAYLLTANPNDALLYQRDFAQTYGWGAFRVHACFVGTAHNQPLGVLELPVDMAPLPTVAPLAISPAIAASVTIVSVLGTTPIYVQNNAVIRVRFVDPLTGLAVTPGKVRFIYQLPGDSVLYRVTLPPDASDTPTAAPVVSEGGGSFSVAVVPQAAGKITAWAYDLDSGKALSQYAETDVRAGLAP